MQNEFKLNVFRIVPLVIRESPPQQQQPSSSSPFPLQLQWGMLKTGNKTENARFHVN